MYFQWPDFLWLMLALPLLVLMYLWLLRRKRKLALRYASLSIVKEAMGPGQTVRRHIPPALFLLALAVMLVAAARPIASVRGRPWISAMCCTKSVAGRSGGRLWCSGE